MEYPAASNLYGWLKSWDFWTFVGGYYDVERGSDYDKWVPLLIDPNKDYWNNDRSLYLNCTIVGFMH